jgi:hypothetical protein
VTRRRVRCSAWLGAADDWSSLCVADDLDLSEVRNIRGRCLEFAADAPGLGRSQADREVTVLELALDRAAVFGARQGAENADSKELGNGRVPMIRGGELNAIALVVEGQFCPGQMKARREKPVASESERCGKQHRQPHAPRNTG